MFDISWGEMALVGAVALLVIKPEDLPGAIRGIGQMVGKVRRMAADFQGQFNQALREAEADKFKSAFSDLKTDMDKATGFDPMGFARDQIKGAVDDVKHVTTPESVIGPPAAPQPTVESQMPPLPKEPELPLAVTKEPAVPAVRKPARKAGRKTGSPAPDDITMAATAVVAAKPAGRAKRNARSSSGTDLTVAPVAEAPKKRRKTVAAPKSEA